MKRKELNEMKLQPVAELEKRLAEHRSKLQDLEFDLAAGKVKNIREIRQLRKNIAQLLSVIGSSKQPAPIP